MDPYVKNPNCSCPRCRASRLFGPAMLITVGVLFLVDQNSYLGFDRSWPVILLVAGLFSYLSRAASLDGHVQPYGTMTIPVAQPGYAQPGYAQPGYAQPSAAPSGYAQPGYPQTSPVQTPGADATTSTHSDPTHNDPTHNDPQVNS